MGKRDRAAADVLLALSVLRVSHDRAWYTPGDGCAYLGAVYADRPVAVACDPDGQIRINAMRTDFDATIGAALRRVRAAREEGAGRN